MDLDSYTKYEMDTEMVLMQEYDGVELPAGETEIHLVLDVGSSAPISEKIVLRILRSLFMTLLLQQSN